MTQPSGSSAPGQPGSSGPVGRASLPEPASTLADRVAASVSTVPGVVRLGGSAFPEVGTYLPGRRVAGVADRGDHLTVSVTAFPAGSLLDLAERVRAAVSRVDARPVDVVIADLESADPDA